MYGVTVCIADKIATLVFVCEKVLFYLVRHLTKQGQGFLLRLVYLLSHNGSNSFYPSNGRRPAIACHTFY